MRRMLLPEKKIKSKIKDDVFSVYFNELKEYMSLKSNGKSVIIQLISQYASEGSSSKCNLNSGETKLEVTNQTLTISYEEGQHIIVNGFMIDNSTNEITTEFKLENSEDLFFSSWKEFDIYIIEQD